MGTRIDPNARFERERQRAKQQETANQQRVQEAIRRKFAAQGLSGGGAEIKLAKETETQSAERLGERMQDISAAEQEQAFQQQQIEDARRYQTSERQAGQKFASEQSRLQRDFAAAEREASQRFTAEENAIARRLQSEQFDRQLTQQEQQFLKTYEADQEKFKFERARWKREWDQHVKDLKFNKNNALKQIELAEQAADLAMEQWDFNKKTEAYNAMQSLANQLGKKLTQDQAKAMIGLFGPDIMEVFLSGFEGGGGGGGGSVGGGGAPPMPQDPPGQGLQWVLYDDPMGGQRWIKARA